VVGKAIVDPNVPPLPPHITLEQARDYVKAILKGDPDAVRIIKASVKRCLPDGFEPGDGLAAVNPALSSQK
jgi:hypothetical protein